MTQPEEALSPEEKLLKVIQDGGESPEEPASAGEPAPEAPAVGAQPEPEPPTPAVEAAAEEAPAAEAPAPKPKLKVAEREEPEQEKPAQSEPEPAPDEDKTAPEAAASAALPLMRKPEEGNYAIRTANRVLMVIVLIMVCLAGFEIWVHANAGMESTPPAARLGKLEAGPEAPGVDLAQVLNEYAERDIFRDQSAPVQPVRSQQQVVVEAEPVAETIKLIGLSTLPDGETLEAILVDSADGKMRFLREGQQVALGEREFEVESVKADHVVLAIGNERITIK